MKLHGGRGIKLHELNSKDGAGLQQMAWSTMQGLSPWHWNKKIKQYRKNTSQEHTLTDYEKDMAALSKHTYNTQAERPHYKDYEYKNELSGANYSVYRNNNTNKNYLVFKGTSDSGDLIPDAAILSGYQNLNASFSNALDTYQNLKNQLAGDWETVGHSLGGTKAMMVAQENGIQSHAFNPGYNNYADDQIDTKYKGHHVYVRKGDPVSNSILTEPMENLKVLASAGYNPVTNHSIETFDTTTTET